MASAGKWKITVAAEGWPAWTYLEYEGQKINGVHHRDLQDLHYAIGRAIAEARRGLGPYHKHELD